MPGEQRLTFEVVKSAVGSGAAFRCRRRLQPAGGVGDKVFPPTFAGAVYAIDRRRVPGRDEAVQCVLLDSVQSQANRMELALQDAVDAGRIKMPLLVVDFSDHGPTGDIEADRRAGRLIDTVGKVTSLQVPHRLADAILRDSELDGKLFRQSERGKALNTVSLANATPLFELHDAVVDLPSPAPIPGQRRPNRRSRHGSPRDASAASSRGSIEAWG